MSHGSQGVPLSISMLQSGFQCTIANLLGADFTLDKLVMDTPRRDASDQEESNTDCGRESNTDCGRDAQVRIPFFSLAD